MELDGTRLQRHSFDNVAWWGWTWPCHAIGAGLKPLVSPPRDRATNLKLER